jgi:Family of unknown function (DUF6223)
MAPWRTLGPSPTWEGLMHDDQLLMIALQATSDPIAVAGYELGVGRTVPTAAAVVGLAAVIVGVMGLARTAARRRAVTALVLGLVAAVVGGLHAAYTAGGVGTGNGLAGALIAVVLGLTGVVLAGLALMRSPVSV